jgi:lipopolysaccharide biosynthesis glycosyltransferase
MSPAEECIGLVTDEGYVAQTCVVLVSYALSNPLNRRDIFVFVDDVSEDGLRMLRITGSAFGLGITFITLDSALLRDLGSGIRKGLPHVSTATYGKLMVPLLLPETYKRCLILDCDTVVRRDLDSLFSTDLQGQSLAAVEDALHAGKSAARLGLPPGALYFNCGVLLVDLDDWRLETPLLRVAGEIEKYRERLLYMEQDFLNIMFHNRFLQLAPQWNAMVIIVPQGVVKNWHGAIEEQSILHFAGEIKPWHEFYHREVRDLYLSYVRNCPWINIPTLGPLGNVQTRCAEILAKEFGLTALAEKYAGDKGEQ